MVLHRGGIILQESVGVAETVAGLGLHGAVPELLCQQQCHLVVLGRLLELPEKNMCVSQVAVRASLCAPVSKLLCDLQPLLVEVYSPVEVPQQVVHIAQVAAGSPLRRSVLKRRVIN